MMSKDNLDSGLSDKETGVWKNNPKVSPTHLNKNPQQKGYDILKHEVSAATDDRNRQHPNEVGPWH